MHGVESACGIPVNDGHGPDVAGFFHAIDEVADEVTFVVGKVFRGLPVLLVGIETCTMDGREQHNLLLGIHTLHRIQGRIDASAEGSFIEVQRAMTPFFPMPRRTAVGIFHAVAGRLIPLSQGDAVVPVVGSHEDDDGIHAVGMFLFQLVSLPYHVIPLASAYAIHIGRDAEPFLQPCPVFLLCGFVSWVGDGIAQIGHSFPLPGVLNQSLCCGWHCQCEAQR